MLKSSLIWHSKTCICIIFAFNLFETGEAECVFVFIGHLFVLGFLEFLNNFNWAFIVLSFLFYFIIFPNLFSTICMLTSEVRTYLYIHLVEKRSDRASTVTAGRGQSQDSRTHPGFPFGKPRSLGQLLLPISCVKDPGLKAAL